MRRRPPAPDRGRPAGRDPTGRAPGGSAGRDRDRPPQARKQRADQLLVEHGLAESRTRAQALILAGVVFAGERRIDKPGDLLAPATTLVVRGRDHPWVSRGGLKLAHALDHFTIDPRDRVCLDVGASTGGFTDVLLARGAARVYAVDVGAGQLAWKLRQDARVVVLERINARRLSAEEIPEPPALITADVSFISLTLVLPPAMALAAADAQLVALIKPQFEAGRGEVGKGGIIRDAAVQQRICAHIGRFLGDAGWSVLGLTASPIAGADGNREFLVAACRPQTREE
ncbi:MAG: TlyA family RNA methyltransferase [Rhodospirillales bacterium]